MFFLTPKYLKNAKLLHKGVTRYLNYKRDLLPADKLDQIETLKRSFEDAMKARDRERLDSLSEEIDNACREALPSVKRSDLADNIEVFFVAIVVALGIRAYIAQPFKIPTGSMQPTLNGIIVTDTGESPDASLFDKALGWLTGRTYIEVYSNHSGRVRRQNPVTEHNWLLWTYSRLHFEDGHSIRIPAPKRQLSDPSIENLGLARHTGLPVNVHRSVMTPDGRASFQIQGEPPYVEEGQLLARGILNSGDHVLVNKFSYHFRQPRRGEVFVFTTNHIRGIEVNIPRDHGSQHYIKRLAGVPGDELEIRSPELRVNGELAQEEGFQKVMSLENGYRGYADGRIFQGQRLNRVTLGEEQYFALGDNSFNSSDSRVWGTVPERNLVGPALFCYLPFTSHWGPIR